MEVGRETGLNERVTEKLKVPTDTCSTFESSSYRDMFLFAN